MKILFASDSFKGSLTSERIVQLLEQAVEQVFPGADTEGMLVADGGEGTMDAVVAEQKGRIRTIEVRGPMCRPVQASYGLLPGGRAIVEMAQASGLPLVKPGERDPMKATTYGTGQLIRDALDQGIRDITIAVGGSATNDGGCGCSAAVLCSVVLGDLLAGRMQDVLFVGTGALMSLTTSQQGESIPGLAHAIELEGCI